MIAFNLLMWVMTRVTNIKFQFLIFSYFFNGILFMLLLYFFEEQIRPAPKEEKKESTLKEKVAFLESILGEGVTLSSRERELLTLILQNKKRKEIASELFLSENTLKTYTRTLFNKLGVKSREEIFDKLNHSFTPQW